MNSDLLFRATAATLLLTCATAPSHAADPPAANASAPAANIKASPDELTHELKAVQARSEILKRQVTEFERKQPEAASLNRARMALGVSLAQEAILLLRLDATPETTFDKASDLIREAESFSVAVDTSSLSVDDQRVYTDLQAVSRRAISQQVIYLHDRLRNGQFAGGGTAVPQPVVVEPAPVSSMPVYATVPLVTVVPNTAPTWIPTQRVQRSCVVFRRGSGR